MRVITGSARGAKLTTLEGDELRPTADRVKEAVFSSIQFEIEGRRVLDLFAGSGQLGIEALSRGAQSATFVDMNDKAALVVKQNLAHVGLFDKATVLTGDFQPFLAHTKTVFDIVFIDPPYSKGLIDQALPLAAAKTSPQGVIVCEAAKRDTLPQQAGDFSLAATRNYGKTIIGYYRVPAKE